MNALKKFLNKTYTDRKTGEIFITSVLALGAVGLIFCLVWFALLCAKGIPLGILIFDIAIIAFCVWAIVAAIIPGAKQIYKDYEKMEYKEKNR